MAAPGTLSVEASRWLAALPDALVERGRPGPIGSLAYDSRRVTPGALFVAIPGFDTDGHRYLDDAIGRGATALLVQADRRPQWAPLLTGDVAVVSVPETRPALAKVAAAFFGEPARRLGVIGVTGTDGKTTTVHLIAHLLQQAGRPAGYLSSVAFSTGGAPELNASHMTTLEAPEVQERLAAMADGGLQYAVLEASSHGLALHRLDCCEFDVAVLTNITSDHLDFHGTIDEYRRAKGRLFEMLDETRDKQFAVARTAVLNADDQSSAELRARTTVPAITYGLDSPADVSARGIRSEGLSTAFELVAPNGRQPVTVRLAGRHNVYNCLAASAVGLSQGLTLGQVASGLESFAGVRGRMELIERGQPFRVVVDIASTSEALRNVLGVLRPATEGRLTVVFGCAGERDPGRRSGMGHIAGELADYAVLTNEDPRSEAPDAIIEDIAAALRAAGRREGEDFVRVRDRRDALRHALERARPGDTVLLAGKGTEQSIVIGREHLPWDERAVARELLGELGWR